MDHIALIEHAEADLAGRTSEYTRYRNYYKGKQPLRFLSDEWTNPFGEQVRGLYDNLCGRVVDLAVDRLTITGVTGLGDGQVDADADTAWDIWNQNRMDARANELFREAGRCGDAYLLVWVEDGQVVLYPHRADTISLRFDPRIPGKVISAVKLWTAGKDRRATVWTAHDLAEYVNGDHGWSLIGEIQPNPLGDVPVRHLPANGDLGEMGRSDIADVVPLQDLLNKSLAGQAVAGEDVSRPLRFALGIDGRINEETGEVEPPFQNKTSKFSWSPADKTVAHIGQLDPPGLSDFLAEQDSLRAEIARVACRPAHLLLQAGDFPSGESLRVAEAPFTAFIRSRMTTWGYQIADVLGMAIQLHRLTQGQATGDRPLFEMRWRDPEPENAKQRQDELRLLVEIGVPLEVALVEYGFTPERAKEIAVAADVKAAEAADRADTLFNRGLIA